METLFEYDPKCLWCKFSPLYHLFDILSHHSVLLLFICHVSFVFCVYLRSLVFLCIREASREFLGMYTCSKRGDERKQFTSAARLWPVFLGTSAHNNHPQGPEGISRVLMTLSNAHGEVLSRCYWPREVTHGDASDTTSIKASFFSVDR